MFLMYDAIATFINSEGLLLTTHEYSNKIESKIVLGRKNSGKE